MSPWPGLEVYNAALAGGAGRLLPADLVGARAALNAWGVPNALSGGFAFIYELTLPSGQRRALRLFHTGREERVAALQEAYRLVKAQRRSGSPLKDYLVEARWVDACIAAGGRTVPGIVMDWVDAPTLGAWLERNHGDAAALRRLRSKLAQLQAALEGAGMVHGDIQTGNIAVRAIPGDLSLILLDYDGFRQAGAASSASEEGHVHFRHPDPAVHGPGADRFPFLAIDLGLQALAADPSLFARFSVGENVLFTGDDYRSPGTSGALAALAGLGGLGRTAEYFAALCRGASSAVPTVARFRAAAGLDDAPAAVDAAHAQAARLRIPAPAAAGPVPEGPYLGQYPVLDPTLLSALANAVGSKVEVVGRIVSIKESRTKYGLPYVFANFGDWRADGTKLIWWSEGLEAFDDRGPDPGWEGRWVSATGLVDEPYRNDRFGTVQYSLTILDPSQVRFLSAPEAARRLGRPTAGFAGAAAARDPGARNEGASRGRRAGMAPSGKPSNAELLAALATLPAGQGDAGGTAAGHAAPPGGTNQPPNGPTSSGNAAWVFWLLGAGALLLWLMGM